MDRPHASFAANKLPAPGCQPADAVLLYGGSFDPIHHGHLISARAVAERIGARRVILLPAARSPFKPDSRPASPEARLEMCRLAAALDPLFEVSDYDLTRPPPSFTIDTVRHFRSTLTAATRLYWLIGADSLASLHDWREIETLVTLVTFVTAARPGFSFNDWSALRAKVGDACVQTIVSNVLETPEIDISSTDIRARVHEGRSVAYLTPECVAQFINSRPLYR